MSSALICAASIRVRRDRPQRMGRRGDMRPAQLRMKPSHSPSAQASVFSIASPW